MRNRLFIRTIVLGWNSNSASSFWRLGSRNSKTQISMITEKLFVEVSALNGVGNLKWIGILTCQPSKFRRNKKISATNSPLVAPSCTRWNPYRWSCRWKYLRDFYLNALGITTSRNRRGSCILKCFPSGNHDTNKKLYLDSTLQNISWRRKGNGTT